MVGKNNKKLLVEQAGARNPQYGIKKLSVGVVSVAVGAVLSLGVTSVQAEEVGLVEGIPVEQMFVADSVESKMEADSSGEVVETDGLVEEIGVESSDSFEASEEIASPVEPLADELVEVEELAFDLDEEIGELGTAVNGEETELELEEEVALEIESIEEVAVADDVEGIAEHGLKLAALSVDEEKIQIMSSNVDIKAPKIISITPSQSEYTANNSPSVTIIVEDQSIIRHISLTYGNREPLNSWGNQLTYFDFYNYGNITEFTKNEDGHYVIELFYKAFGYQNAAGTYELNSIGIEDELGNRYYDDGTKHKSSFIYYEYEGQDFTDPILQGISTDKTVYHVGETVEVSIIVEEDKELHDVQATFRNTGDFGPGYLNFSAHENGTINKIAENLFEYTGSFLLPEALGPTSYSLENLNLNNISMSIWNNDFEEISFEVVNDAVEKVITDFDIIYTTNYEEVTTGTQGIKYLLEDGSEVIISDLVNEVKMYDQGDYYYSYETIYRENYDIPYQERYWQQYGQDGYKTVFYDNERNIVEEIIHYQAQDEIIEVGVVEEVYTPFETIYEDDPWRHEGSVWDDIKEYGVMGKIKRIYDLDGNIVEETVLESATNEVIVRGTIPLTIIPYGTDYTYWDYDVREGYNGGKYVYPDGTEYIESHPQNAVILHEGVLIEIPFETEFTYWDYEVRDGYNGMKFIHEDGREVFLQGQTPEVLLYDSDVVDVPRETEYRKNYNEYIGYEEVSEEGWDGSERVFYDGNGVEIYRSIINYAQNKVIELGVLTDALVEDRDASSHITNAIRVTDIDTGEEIESINLNGEEYLARIHEFIRRYNQANVTNLEFYLVKSIEEFKETKVSNAEYVDFIHRNIEILVDRKLVFDLSGEEAPLIPDEIKIDYNNLNTYLSQYSQVNIFNGNNLLLDFSVDAAQLVPILPNQNYEDLIIIKSLNLLDADKYYFARAEMLQAPKNNLNTGTLFNIYVKERLSKELVEAEYKTEFTNDPNQVRAGQNGTKYVYSDGNETIVAPPVNEVVLTTTPLLNKPTIDSITVNRDVFSKGEYVELTVHGTSGAEIKKFEMLFRDINAYTLMWFNVDTDDIVYNNGNFTAKVQSNYRIQEWMSNDKFTFDFAKMVDSNGANSDYIREVELNLEQSEFRTVSQPFSAEFISTNANFLGTESVPFETQYTTNEAEVREGQVGSKWVYSDGSEVVLEEAVAAVALYDREVADVAFETEYTVYAHEVRAGIKGAKFVYENGVEVVVDGPISAVALYANKVEEFEFTTVEIENSGLAFGKTQVLQEGLNGRRVVFYDASGDVVDRLVVSNPVSRIVQVGANQMSVELTPYDTTYTTDISKVKSGQNGAKYLYADGTEKVIKSAINGVVLYNYVDEVVEFKEVTRENAELAQGMTRVISEGTSGLKRVFYDAYGEIVEERLTFGAVDRVIEVGTLVVVSEENDEDNVAVVVPDDGDSDEAERPVETDTPDSGDTDSDSDSEVDPGASDSGDAGSGSDEELESVEPDTSETDEDLETGVDENTSDNDSGIEAGEGEAGVSDDESTLPISPVVAANVLPDTGERYNYLWLTVAAVSMLAGLGLVVKGKKEEEA